MGFGPDTPEICADLPAIKSIDLMSQDIDEKLHQLHGLVDHSVADMLDLVFKELAETRGTRRPGDS
jgi:CBS-domain-containing membrane protein